MWVYFNTLPATDFSGIFQQYQSNSTRFGLQVENSGDKGLQVKLNSSGSNIFEFYEGVDRTTPVGSWAHLALTRQGNVFRIFLNGSIIVEGSDSGAIPDISGALRIGRYEYTGQISELNGYMTGIRITKGVSRYNSNFSPRTMVPSVAPTLWLPMQTNAYNSGNTAFTTSTNVISYGTAGSRSTAVFTGVNGAAGSSRVMVTSNQANLNLGTGDFTFEAWVYPNTVANQPYIMDYRPVSDQTANFPAVRLRSDSTVTLQTISGGATSPVYTTTATLTVGAWNHIALVRKSGTHKIYINGVASGSYSVAESYSVTAGVDRPTFGTSGWSYNGTLDGYMYGIKIYVGTALYETSFTPVP